MVLATVLPWATAVPSRAAPSEQGQRRSGFRAATATERGRAHVRPGTGPCAGMFEFEGQDPAAANKSCTHGPDVYEAGATAEAVAAASATPSNGQIAASIPCYGSGPYVRVLYVYPGTNYLDAASPNARRPLIREAVGLADKLFYNAGKATDGYRRVKWKMTSGCNLSITAVQMSDMNSISLFTMRQRLVSAGKLRTSEKGLAFLESASCSGLGEVIPNASSSSTNPNNKGNMLAQLSVFGCLNKDSTVVAGGEVTTHELIHTLGAVQPGAPKSTGQGFHCRDEADVMCYNDGYGTTYARCKAVRPEPIDCGKDTYFDVTPSSSEWLANNWNTAKNQFLARGGAPSVDLLDRPSITLTSPTNGAVAAGNLTVSATASAPTGSTIRHVQFFADGVLVATDTSAPYSVTVPTAWDGSAGWRNNSYPTFTAYAVDSYNRPKKSGSAKVTIGNPTVRLTSPTTMAGVARSFNWSAVAEIASPRTIQKVDLLVNGAVAGTDTSAASGGVYSGSATIPGAVTAGDTVTVAARVTDGAGVTRTTATREVQLLGPSVELISPSYGEQISNELLLVAKATPPPGATVDSVTFTYEGSEVGVGTPAGGSLYELVWNAPASPTWGEVQAVVTDSNGDTAPSAGGSVSIDLRSDDVALSVGTPTGDVIPLSAVVTPTGSTDVVATVTFNVDGNWVGNDDDGTDGYSASWDTAGATPGAHIVRAVASIHTEDWGQYWDAASAGETVTTNSPASMTIATPATVSGTSVTITPSFTLPDGYTVSGVNYKANELWVDSAWDAPYSGSWDTSGLADGTYTLRATATIATPDFNSFEISSTRSVTVQNLRVELREPDPEEVITGTKTLYVYVRPDADSQVEWVRFYVSGVYVGRDGTPTTAGYYTLSWNSRTVSDARRQFKATATTSDGRYVYAAHAAVVNN